VALSLYWIVGGGCDGDSMSLLNMDSPNLLDLAGLLDLKILWHPSLSPLNARDYRAQNERLLSGDEPLDIFCVEGSVIRGPGGTGMYDTVDGKPKKDLIAALAQKAKFVVAVGTCAGFGGIGADGEIEATGMQFHKEKMGGFLGPDFRSAAGLPVVNLAGCPCHPDVVKGAVTALANGIVPELDEFNRPREWFGMLVHQGCTRNEYHEYRVEEKEFGEKGCLFFHKGCHGPLAFGPCNKVLWNKRSSKTRAGVPCFGCTSPNFPQAYPFFESQNIEGIPLNLPVGISRAHYLAYKGMAAAAAPERLKKRDTKI